jgi:hypothetical protein
MFRASMIALAAVAAVSTIATSDAFAAAKCTSVQAGCALEVGGRCNPATGRWDVHRHGAGGNLNAFLACLDRERRK